MAPGINNRMKSHGDCVYKTFMVAYLVDLTLNFTEMAATARTALKGNVIHKLRTWQKQNQQQQHNNC